MFSAKVQLFSRNNVALNPLKFLFHSSKSANHFIIKTVFFRLKVCFASHTNKKLERTERY